MTGETEENDETLKTAGAQTNIWNVSFYVFVSWVTTAKRALLCL
jgi:hypothetical protein